MKNLPLINLAVDGIIFDIQNYGGISRIYHEILPRMCSLNTSLQVDLYTNHWGRQNPPQHNRIHHHQLWPIEKLLRPGRFWWKTYPRLRQWQIDQNIDSSQHKIWHSTYYTTPKHWSGPVVVSVYDMIHERFPQFFSTPTDAWFKMQKQHSIENADVVLCISAATQNDVCNLYGLNPVKTRVVHLAPNDAFYSDKNLRSLPTDKPFLLYVGQRGKYKNTDLLLEAIGAWPQKNEVDLIFVGDAWQNCELENINRLGLQSNIKLLQHVQDHQLNILYNQAIAFVYPSLYEGFGIPLLEAMACGCPVIASRIPSTVEIANQCPIYVASSSKDELIAAFDLVLAEGRNSTRSQAGLKHAKKYSWDKTAEQILKEYHALLNVN